MYVLALGLLTYKLINKDEIKETLPLAFSGVSA